MKNLFQYFLRVLAIVFFITLFSGCYMFHKKNRCGDCPKWKVELNNALLSISK